MRQVVVIGWSCDVRSTNRHRLWPYWLLTDTIAPRLLSESGCHICLYLVILLLFDSWSFPTDIFSCGWDAGGWGWSCRFCFIWKNMATTVWRDIKVSFRHPIPLYTILALSLRSVAPFHHVKFSDIWGPNGLYRHPCLNRFQCYGWDFKNQLNPF